LTNVKNKMQEVQKNVLENMAELGFHSGALQTPAINRPPPSKGFPNKLYKNMGRNCGLSDLSFIFTNSPFEQNRCKFINKPTQLFLIFKGLKNKTKIKKVRY